MSLKRFLVWVSFTAVLLSGFIAMPAQASESDVQVAVMLAEERANRDIVFATVEGADPLDTVAGSFGFGIEPLSEDTFLLKLPWWSGLKDVLTQLLEDPQVRFAEPNYAFVQVADPVLPNDPDLDLLWGLGPHPGANAYGAWNQGVTGSEDVYIAVLDTGIDYTHPDIAANMWVNQAELNGTAGVDDDGNGVKDDIYGYDFVRDVPNVLSGPLEDPHGTHVAGTIAAVGNNGIGVSGMAWSTKLISVKVLHDGSGSSESVLRGLKYVEHLRTKQGLNIVATNNSYGGPHYSQAIEEAINRHGDAGILFVAAAGNTTSNLENVNAFPASLSCVSDVRDFDCLISVGATNSVGNLASFSNFGSTKVDLAAPGVGIGSTVVQYVDEDSELVQYAYEDGTSMAAPHVTGAIALCAAANPGMSAKEIRQAILATATYRDNLAGKSVTGGILNAGALVQACLNSVEPAMTGAPAQFHATATYTDRVRLEWDDSVTGEHGYTITYSSGTTGCTTAGNNHLAYIGPGISAYEVLDLDESTMYCFTVKATRGAQSSARLTSNLTITFTSNLPFISGTLFMEDGTTPVENAFVFWSATPGNGVGGYTDENGFYKVQASPSILGNLVVLGPTRYTGNSVIQTTPRLPLSFRLNGTINIAEDTTVNLTLPEFNTVTVTTLDEENQSPVAGARILAQSVNGNSTRCSLSKNDWRPSALLEPLAGSYCSYSLPDPITAAAASAADGTYSFEVLDAFQQGGTNATFPIRITATNATNNLIAGRIQVNTDVSVSASLTMLSPKTVTGTVTLYGGEVPVVNATVRAGTRTAQTDASGSYAIQMTKLDATQMRVTLEGADESLVPPTLLLQGLLAGDALGPVDWVLPETNRLTFSVRDDLTEEALASAPITFRPRTSNTLGCMVSSNDYSPSNALTYSSLRPCLYGPYARLTNQSGEATFTILDGFYQNGRQDYTIIFSAEHPTDNTRASELTVETGADANFVMAIAGNPVLSGTVLMHDGVTPVQNALITYETVSGSFSSQIRTDASGQYSLTVPGSVPGKLYLKQSVDLKSAYPTGQQTIPEVPLGFQLGGNITPTEDTNVNLVLPQLRTFYLTVRDIHNEEPIADAEVFLNLVNGDSFHCGVSPNDYKPSALLTYSVRPCNYRPAGQINMPALTDEFGQISLVMLDGWYQAANEAPVRVRVQHPIDGARVAEVVLASNQNQTVNIELPGTPSEPEQPSVTATSNSVTLGWEEPWDGGAFIDYYRVYIATDAGGPFELVSSGTCVGNVAPDQRSCTVTGLTPGETYYFAIVAFNVVGASGFSAAAMSRLSLPAPETTQESSPVPTTPTVPNPPPPGPPPAAGPPPAGGGAPGGPMPPALPTPALAAIAERSSLPEGAQLLMPEDSKMLQVRSEVWSFSLMTSEQAIGSAGMFEITQKAQSPIELTGYQPVSKVEIYLEVANFNAMGQLSEFLLRAMTRVIIGTYETDLEGKLSAELVIPNTVAGGSYAMTVVGVDEKGQAVTFSLPIAVKQSVDLSLGVWTKRMVGNTQAKLYAKDVIGQGKVSFRVNGKEIAWVRAVDATDPRLRLVTTGPMAGANYLVRTVNLQKGKNVLEIFVDGKRLTRTAYSRR